MTAIEQVASEDNPSRLQHLERLEEIYCSLLGPATTRRRYVGKLGDHGVIAKGPLTAGGRQRARLHRMSFQKAWPAEIPGVGTERRAKGLGRPRG